MKTEHKNHYNVDSAVAGFTTITRLRTDDNHLKSYQFLINIDSNHI